MRTISPRHCALSVCAAAAMLVDCGGPSQFANSDVQAPVSARLTEPPGSPRIELLTGASKGHCKRSHSGLFGSCDFKASGTATGPYPGTFTAHGAYYFCEVYCMWTFEQSFTITSGTAKISGSTSVIRGGLSPPFPAFYPYTGSLGDGRIKIDAVGPYAPFRKKVHAL